MSADNAASEATGWRHEYRYARESRASLVFWMTMSAVLVLGVAGGAVWLIRTSDFSFLALWSVWMRALFYAVNLFMFAFVPLAILWWQVAHFIGARAHADDVAILDERGLTLRRKDGEQSLRWEEIGGMREHLAGYRLRTRDGACWIVHGFEDQAKMLAELREHLPGTRK